MTKLNLEQIEFPEKEIKEELEIMLYHKPFKIEKSDLMGVLGRVIIKKYGEVSTDEIIQRYNKGFGNKIERSLEQRGYKSSGEQYYPK